MRILIRDDARSPFDETCFAGLVSCISKHIKIDDEQELSVWLTDDEQIRFLNASYRKVDAPTDVLSFPMNDEILFGDIVISLDTAARQAQEREISLSREVAFLFIHGFLHLSGYDHEDSEGNELTIQANEMYSLQEDVLRGWVEQNEH
ncbi:hypothetical protein RsTz2092_05290 [Deferribacterales bacterium RsTz2092]